MIRNDSQAVHLSSCKSARVIDLNKIWQKRRTDQKLTILFIHSYLCNTTPPRLVTYSIWPILVQRKVHFNGPLKQEMWKACKTTLKKRKSILTSPIPPSRRELRSTTLQISVKVILQIFRVCTKLITRTSSAQFLIPQIRANFPITKIKHY